MGFDLYSANLDSISFSDVENFLGMSGPIERRPTEGILLDFKSSDSGEWVDSVVAFANTAGGILLLGVESDKIQNNSPVAIPGLEFAGGDIKARLTSTLVSRIIPRPDFDIAAAALPQDLRDTWCWFVYQRDNIRPTAIRKAAIDPDFQFELKTHLGTRLYETWNTFSKSERLSAKRRSRVFNTSPLCPSFLNIKKTMTALRRTKERLSPSTFGQFDRGLLFDSAWIAPSMTLRLG